MIWFLYNLLFLIIFPLLIPYFLLRMRRRGGYRKDFLQRIGRYRPDVQKRLEEGGRVWMHAVSVGEVYVALQVMKGMREKNSDVRFTLSVTTSTGHAIAEEELDARDVLIYFPVDCVPVMKRILTMMRPSAVMIIETELWPNLIRLSHDQKIPIMLVNGRLSDKSYRGYQKLTAFTRRVLPLFSCLYVQSERDRERYVVLGAPAEKVMILGSVKYETAHKEDEADEIASTILARAGVSDDRTILLGGSTWPGEERVLVDLYQHLKLDYPKLALVIAPRHVERMPEIMEELKDRTLQIVRRSELDKVTEATEPDLLFIDTTGELKFLYSCADIIFIGKSLSMTGGQNPIEAAVYSKPVIVGPNMQNFPAIMDDFKSKDALIQVQDEDGLQATAKRLLDEPDYREQIGQRASQLVKEKCGAVARTVDLIFTEIARSE